MPERLDKRKHSIFWEIFLTHFVLSSFLGLIFIEMLYHILTPVHHDAKHFSIPTIIAGAILNGFILALFIWGFHWLRDRWRFKHKTYPHIDAFYFCVVMMTTLGFGDIVPLTLSAKIVVSLQCMISYVMFGLMIGTITRGGGQSKRPRREDRSRRTTGQLI